MYPLVELFSRPFTGLNVWGDLPVTAVAPFTGDAVYYNGVVTPVSFVRSELVACGLSAPAVVAFLATSQPARFGFLSAITDAVRNWRSQSRDDVGRWAQSQGVAPDGAGDPVHAAAATAVVDRSLATSRLSSATANKYRTDALAVVHAMTPVAQERFARNVDRVAFQERFAYISPVVRAELIRINDRDSADNVPDGACGAYVKGSQTIVVNGGVPQASASDGVHAAGVMAHEFTHGIDGPNDEISRSGSWRNAWEVEIQGSVTPPSGYAQGSPSDGFAEFGRMVFLNRAAAAKMYPLCASVWKQNRLM